MTISIKPTASGSTIEQDGSTILTVDGSGNIAIANDLSVTGNVPANTGPAFRATLSADQTGVADVTWTKVELDTEDWDTDSCFDTSTYRFTPTVAGYYQFNAAIFFAGTSRDTSRIAFYKNGSVEWHGTIDRSGTSSNTPFSDSALIYLNGSTDYVELYGYINNSTADRTFLSNTTLGYTVMSGHLVRSA